MNDRNILVFATLVLANQAACRSSDPVDATPGTDTEAATDGATDGDTDTDTDTDTEGVDPNPASPAVRELLDTACALGLRCCSRGEIDYYLGPWIDAESCADRLFDLASVSNAAALDLSVLAGLTDVALILPNLPALDQAVQDGRIVMDAEAMAACRAHLAGVACNEPQEVLEGCQPLPPPPEDTSCDLEDLFIGQLSEGAECTSIDGFSLDCAPGLTCGVGLGLGTQGRCVALKQAGEPCTAPSECDDELFCSPLDGTCQPPRGAGEVCVFADREDPNPTPETLLLGCSPELSCDPITSTCVARCQSGAACLSDDDCDQEQQLSCILGRCGAARAEGLPCGADDDCETGLRCGPDLFDATATVCVGPKPNQAACTLDDECESGFCHPGTGRCSPQAAVNSPCTSGVSAECDGGACVPEQPLVTCTGPSDCPITQSCDVITGSCGTYCVPAKQDGATCLLDSECSSDTCIAGFCRSVPLDAGIECELAEQCESGFCSYDVPRVCADLPLDLGAACLNAEECASSVCFASLTGGLPECIAGAEEGELCGDAERPPCNPALFYCDFEADDAPTCAPLKETGDPCRSASECRGDCALRHGRLLCTPAAVEDEAICDGQE